MKTLLALCVPALVFVGCATSENTRMAEYGDCKVAPVTAQSAAGGPNRSTELERRMAEMQLANSDYRRRELARNPGYGSNVEEALRDCARK